MSLPSEGVNANALTETTAIPTGKKLIFLDPDTNEGGIITLENLTKQILSNLVTQTFDLDQGTKTLLTALNELNSKTLVFANTLTKNNTDKIDIELPSSKKMCSPFILTVLDWATGKCDIVIGAYRNKDYEQIPVMALDTTGEATISYADGILTLEFTKRHSCLVAYY